MYRTTLGAFEQIEANILMAARTLGSSEWSIFGQVMIPLAYRGIVAGTILAFARALGEFGATLMLAGNIPGQTQTMPLAIFFASESGDYQTALIWVLILLFISLSVIIIVNFWAESKHVRQSRTAVMRSPNTQKKNITDQANCNLKNPTKLNGPPPDTYNMHENTTINSFLLPKTDYSSKANKDNNGDSVFKS